MKLGSKLLKNTELLFLTSVRERARKDTSVFVSCRMPFLNLFLSLKNKRLYKHEVHERGLSLY